jgi:hypothetical protein
MGGEDADTRGFMMGSPNATVYRLRSVGLILDDLARVGCCGGATNVNPIHAGGRPAGADAGGGGEGAGRLATDTGREWTRLGLKHAMAWWIVYRVRSRTWPFRVPVRRYGLASP